MKMLNKYDFRPLIKAIDRFIAKDDSKFADKLKKLGFKNSKELTKYISQLEKDIYTVINKQRLYIESKIDDYDDLYDVADDIDIIAEQDESPNRFAAAFKLFFASALVGLAGEFLKAYDKTLKINNLSARSQYFIDNWSTELGLHMSRTSYKSLELVVRKAIKSKIEFEEAEINLKDLYAFSAARARRCAETETMTVNSIANQEAMTQCPAIIQKTWRHTDLAEVPRQNHIDMDGQTVKKEKRFTLIGADGATYYPLCPCDFILPPGERINCHCQIDAIFDDDVLGLSAKQKDKLRKKALAQLDKEYAKKANAKNKLRAGIDEKTIKMTWLRAKTKEQQIKYLGTRSRWALIEAGIIKNDDDLSRLYKKVTLSDGTKRNVRKTLQELKDDGIITISEAKLTHSTIGKYVNPSSKYPKGRLDSGGHNQSCINELDKKGIKYKIEKTYSNGVRIGGVENHKSNFKKIGTVGQAWFPKNWTDDDVLIAGTYVVNSPSKIIDGIYKFDTYKGVRVCVIYTDGVPSTIFPDNSKQPFKDKWEVTDIGKYKASKSDN